MAWEWELRSLDGGAIGHLRPRSARVTRTLNGPSIVEVEADSVPLLTTAAVVRGWRAPAGGGARVLRASAKVKPVGVVAARDSLERITLHATDGFGVLADRYVATARSFTAQTPRAIIDQILDDQNARAWTGLSLHSNAGGPARDRTYEVGKNVAEIIQQLAEVDDGFYFRVDPVDLVDDGAGNLAFYELVLLHPAPGTDAVAPFGFGEGTMANLAGVQVDTRPPINHAMAFGAGSGDTQLVATASDAASIALYGLVDAVASFSDVTVEATLSQHALDMLRPNERRTFRVEVATSTDNGELYTPSPWDDFDVGDTVRLGIRTDALTYEGTALVKSFTVTVDADGVERLASLDFQQED